MQDKPTPNTQPTEGDREAEDYCVALLTEEMGEVLQPLGKAGRFGMDTPGVKRLDGTVDMSITPRMLLAQEIGDLAAAIEFSACHGLYDRDEAGRAKARKLAKLLDPTALDNLGRPLAPQPPSQPQAAGDVEKLRDAADAWDAFVKARGAMNAARPDPIFATTAERALYDERYQADHEAERTHFRTAIYLAQVARAILEALSATPPAPADLVEREDTYRGWKISQGRWPEPPWHATGPNYDASWEGEEDGWHLSPWHT